MPDTTVRLARPEDESQIDAFLAGHADSSLYLRSFLAQGGILDEGKPLQGTYAIALSAGQIAGVAMQNRQSAVFLQAPENASELVGLVLETTGHPLVALLGPWSQVETAYVGLGKPPAQKQSREGLFALNLSELVAPAPLALETVSCRRAEGRDLDLLRDWRFEYDIENTGLPNTDATRSFSATAIEGHVERGEAFLLEVGGAPVSLCTQNARAVDAVQIGGVWTPPALRGRGYARRVVAGALEEAEKAGATRAVLFTDHPAARRTYQALGFQQIGDYGIIIFATDPAA